MILLLPSSTAPEVKIVAVLYLDTLSQKTLAQEDTRQSAHSYFSLPLLSNGFDGNEY